MNIPAWLWITIWLAIMAILIIAGFFLVLFLTMKATLR